MTAIWRRLIELAREQAFVKHAHYVLLPNTQGHVQGMNDREWGFSACPHPDCAALRACAEAPATMTEDFNGTQPVKENPPVPLTAACFDCGLDYSAFGMDMLLPRWQWLMIHPSDVGLLCAGCIVKRAANIPGTVALHAVIGIAPPKEPK